MSSNSLLKSKTALTTLGLSIGLTCTAWAEEGRMPQQSPRVTQNFASLEPPPAPVLEEAINDFPALEIREARQQTVPALGHSRAPMQRVGDRGFFFGTWQPPLAPRPFPRQAMLGSGVFVG